MSPITGVRDQVISIRTKNPRMTGAAIGRSVGVSRERVRQIIVDSSGNKTIKTIKLQCRQCFKPLYSKRSIFCSSECLYNYHHVILKCSWCGKLYSVRIGIARAIARRDYKHTFCSSKCFGQWRHVAGGKPRKYDYDLIWEVHLKTGFGTSKLGRYLGIPRSSIQRIFEKMRKLKSESTLESSSVVSRPNSSS